MNLSQLIQLRAFLSSDTRDELEKIIRAADVDRGAQLLRDLYNESAAVAMIVDLPPAMICDALRRFGGIEADLLFIACVQAKFKSEPRGELKP